MAFALNLGRMMSDANSMFWWWVVAVAAIAVLIWWWASSNRAARATRTGMTPPGKDSRQGPDTGTKGAGDGTGDEGDKPHST